MNKTKHKPGFIIAKCRNGNCGWEARDFTEVDIRDDGGLYCPICGDGMVETN